MLASLNGDTAIYQNEESTMKKTGYQRPRLKVHGTVKQLTHGVKQLTAPSDGNYLSNKDNPLNGSCHCD